MLCHGDANDSNLLVIGDVADHHPRELHDKTAKPLILRKHGVDIDAVIVTRNLGALDLVCALG
jgi:hypothetical protein